jgi:hypothetical protein
MKKTLLFLLSSLTLFAAPFLDYGSSQKIAVQNAILAKVNGKTISMMDVKKKMDMILHQNYPQLSDSNQGRFQFYEGSWRQVLREIINQELIISDALDKEIKLSDGDIREVMEERFGPNVMQTLDKIGLTYDETWKMVKNELIVQRMMWWFVQSKAVGSVTPQDIRQAYRLYLEEHPPYAEWKYQVISVRMEHADDILAKEIYDKLSETSSTDALKEFEKEEGISIAVSKEFVAKSQDLSETHKGALEDLTFGSFSQPSLQMGKDKKAVYRIFYLIDKTDYPAPKFETLAAQLKNALIQEAVVQESDVYLNKLRKFYGFAEPHAIPDDLHPFSLQ